jgi:hypothetical protein
MGRVSTAIAYLDAPRLLRALSAGTGRVFQRREYLNRINVFPVPDGDTGTNMAFTFKTILEATATSPDDRVDRLMDHVAAEAATQGKSADQVEALLQQMAAQTRVLAVADDLSFAVRGGRVPAWVKRITDWLHLNPVLTASPEGKLTLGGFHAGRGARPMALARTTVRIMQSETMYRVQIAHVNNERGATETRHHILENHGTVHSCHITEAGPALGVHLGLGGLIVGFMPQPEMLNDHAPFH